MLKQQNVTLTEASLTKLIFLRVGVLPMWSLAVSKASWTYGCRLMGTLGLCEGGTSSWFLLRVGLGLKDLRMSLWPPCGGHR